MGLQPPKRSPGKWGASEKWPHQKRREKISTKRTISPDAGFCRLRWASWSIRSGVLRKWCAWQLKIRVANGRAARKSNSLHLIFPLKSRLPLHNIEVAVLEGFPSSIMRHKRQYTVGTAWIDSVKYEILPPENQVSRRNFGRTSRELE